MNVEKHELRQRFCALRDSQSPEDIAAASQALCQRLAGWPLLRQARTVLAYIAFRNELDLRPLFARLPEIQWLAPRVVGREMVLHPYDPDRLAPHRFGMLEPEASLPQVGPEEVDIVLVPGVAFDRYGARLGYGGGFYDRFLPGTSALRVGIALESAVAEALPCAEHDQRMDWIATPERLIRCLPPDPACD